MPAMTWRADTSVRTTGAVVTGTWTVVAGGAACGHSQRVPSPADATTTTPAVRTTGTRRRRARGATGWPARLRDNVDIRAVPVREVPLADLRRLPVSLGLGLRQRRRQPERPVRIRVGPVRHAMLAHALGVLDELPELGLRDRG